MIRQIFSKRVIFITTAIVLILLVVLRLKGNHEKIEKSKQQVSDKSTIVTVNVARAIFSEPRQNLELVGKLSSYSEVVVAAKAQGQIVALNVELGQHKGRGANLGLIDSRYKKIDFENAKNNLDKQKKNYERYKNLSTTGAASQQQLDDALNSYNSAKYDFEQKSAQLTDASIESPIDGYIVEKNAELGSYVNVGSAIAKIADVSRLKIKLNVSEFNIYSLKVNEKVSVTTDVYPGYSWEGRISFISTKGDDAHTYPVEVEIKNNAQHPLKAGTFAKVKVNLASAARTIAIPREALQGSIQDAKVYVVVNGRALLRNITVSGSDGSSLFVASGVSLDEQVVVSGQINLSNGREVKILQKN